MANPALIAKAAAIILTDEKAQKAAGWTLVAILSPSSCLSPFYALYFGTGSHGDAQSFADCFVTWEERIRTVLVEGSDPPEETEEIYSAAIPIEDLGTVWQNIAALPGTVTVSTYNRGGYGYYVMIDHGNGLSTLYGHNSQLLALGQGSNDGILVDAEKMEAEWNMGDMTP